MKLQLANVTIGKIEIQSSKKNVGGAFAKLNISVNANKVIRKAMGIGEQDETGKMLDNWPPAGEKSGTLRGSLAATSMILTA